MLIIILLIIVLLLYLLLMLIKREFKGNHKVNATIYLFQNLLWILITVINWNYYNLKFKIIFIAMILITLGFSLSEIFKRN